uniref:Nudix hydrolase domain-containing protein n=1 Tax=viral metagenome TaxID=1070528 RepID=A0A6C0BZI2_9ZZZZ
MNEKKFGGHENPLASMRLTGAGVLVYTVRDGNILVLLGREKYTPGWRQGSHKWSTFSGKVDLHENALEGAAREFLEESCACVPVLAACELPATLPDVMDRLRSKARQVEQITYFKGERLVYCTFIMHIPYDVYDEVFRDSITKLHELDSICRFFYRTWKLASIVPRFMRPGYALSSCLVVANVRVTGNSEVELVLHEDGDTRDVITTLEVSAEVARALKIVQEAWSKVLTYLELRVHDPILLHPAVDLKKSRQIVVGARVNKAYLEKCEIRWWKLEELLNLQDIQSTAGQESEFRKLFIENISNLATHIKMMEKNSQTGC